MASGGRAIPTRTALPIPGGGQSGWGFTITESIEPGVRTHAPGGGAAPLLVAARHLPAPPRRHAPAGPPRGWGAWTADPDAVARAGITGGRWGTGRLGRGTCAGVVVCEGGPIGPHAAGAAGGLGRPAGGWSQRWTPGRVASGAAPTTSRWGGGKNRDGGKRGRHLLNQRWV